MKLKKERKDERILILIKRKNEKYDNNQRSENQKKE